MISDLCTLIRQKQTKMWAAKPVELLIDLLEACHGYLEPMDDVLEYSPKKYIYYGVNDFSTFAHKLMTVLPTKEEFFRLTPHILKGHLAASSYYYNTGVPSVKTCFIKHNLAHVFKKHGLENSITESDTEWGYEHVWHSLARQVNKKTFDTLLKTPDSRRITLGLQHKSRNTLNLEIAVCDNMKQEFSEKIDELNMNIQPALEVLESDTSFLPYHLDYIHSNYYMRLLRIASTNGVVYNTHIISGMRPAPMKLLPFMFSGGTETSRAFLNKSPINTVVAVNNENHMLKLVNGFYKIRQQELVRLTNIPDFVIEVAQQYTSEEY